MKKMESSLLISMGILLLMAVPSQQNEELVWTDRGCDASYIIGEPITIYFQPHEGVEFELWAYDAIMHEKLLSSGVSDGQTYSVEVTAESPPGPLTFVLKMPCESDCQYCDMCDYGQCTVHVEVYDPCQDHCTNREQDCGEYGVDCGGGCPFTDSDADGVEDCIDLCPDSLCHRVDAHGCETDTDTDGVTDCEDECPNEQGDPSHKGCPSTSTNLLILGIGIIAVGGLALWRMRQKH